MAADSLLADLTCSLCLNLYDAPKLMPNCPHTFCTSCIEKLVKSELSADGVRCPECRAVNKVPENLSELPSNIVAQGIIEKIKKQQEAEQMNGEMCCHYVLGESREKCAHCNNMFCYGCKYRHMEKITTAISEMVGVLDKMEQLPSPADFEKQTIDRLDQDDDAIGKQMNSMTEQLDSIFAVKMGTIAEISTKLLNEKRNMFSLIAAKYNEVSRTAGEMRSLLRKLASGSIFSQNLNEVSQLYIDLSNAADTVQLIVC